MTPVLDWALTLALFMLALAMGCALIRLLKGPSAQDRVLALDCMYLSGMLVMLVLGVLILLSALRKWRELWLARAERPLGRAATRSQVATPLAVKSAAQ